MPESHDHYPLGRWDISGELLLHMLKRVEQGEDAGVVYAEHYANCRRENDAP